MLKVTLFIATVSIVIGQCFCLAADKSVLLEKMKHYEKYKDILLDSSEVPKVSTKKDISLPWTRGIGAEGKPSEVDGFVQEFEVQDSPVKIILQYGRFADTNTAQEAFAFHVKDVAIVFDAKPWPDLNLAKSDEVLFAESTASSSILLRDQKTCVLISCLGGSLEERRKTSVVFGNRILGRLRAEERGE